MLWSKLQSSSSDLRTRRCLSLEPNFIMSEVNFSEEGYNDASSGDDEMYDADDLDEYMIQPGTPQQHMNPSNFPPIPTGPPTFLPPSANVLHWTSFNNVAAGGASTVTSAFPAVIPPANSAPIRPSVPVVWAAPVGVPAGAIPPHQLPTPVGMVPGAIRPPVPVGAGGAFPAMEHMVGMSGVRAGKHWDPSHSTDWDRTKPSDLCLGRISRDLQNLYADPIPGVIVHAYESNVTKMVALITGPVGTPYEGGFFEFFLRVPPDYPISHPRMRLLTTGGGTVRFNPNLYADGKVCLSLLGTWSGPAWSPALNISALLLSVQSLMGEFPFLNEPGFDKVSTTSPEVLSYNLHIVHETMRVAVIDMVRQALDASQQARTLGTRAQGDNETSRMPESFRTTILNGFVRQYSRYLEIVEKNKKVTFKAGSSRHGMFAHGGATRAHIWPELLTQLGGLKALVEAELAHINPKPAADEGMVDGDGSD